jgi:queuine tRNA-ribosyltransferase
MERTERWLLQSKERHDLQPFSEYGFKQALFGIIQGGSFRDYREKCAEFAASLDLDGLAIGGEAIGFDMPKTSEIIEWVRPILPESKPRYTMGVGLNPQDLIDVVSGGIDIFDCVAPTRNARHGALYHGHAGRGGGDSTNVDETKNILIKKDCIPSTINLSLKAVIISVSTIQEAIYIICLQNQAHAILACIHNIRVMQKPAKSCSNF